MFIRRPRAWDAGRPAWPFRLHEDCSQAQGLIAWWPFHEHNAVNVLDLIGLQRATKQLAGQTGIKQDREFGQVAVISSSQAGYQLGVGLRQGPPTTLCAWFLATNLTARQTLVHLGDTVNYSELSLNLAGDVASDPIEAYSCGASSGQVSVARTSTSYLTNTWHHGAAVFAATNDRRAMLDGAGTGTETTSRTQTSMNRTALFMRNTGWNSLANQACASGTLLADVRIYARGLEETEVAALYDPETRWDLYYPVGRKAWLTVALPGPAPPSNVGLLTSQIVTERATRHTASSARATQVIAERASTEPGSGRAGQVSIERATAVGRAQVTQIVVERAGVGPIYESSPPAAGENPCVQHSFEAWLELDL